MYQDGQCPLGIWKGAESAAGNALLGRTAAGTKKVGMMADVACFCGCLYSFDGAAGACPQCGEIASVATGPAPGSTGQARPDHRVPIALGVRQDGQAPGTFPEWVEARAGALAGVGATSGADDPD